MLDVGMSEIALIGVVALVVLGPERLPKVARTAGHMFGRLQRYVANVKSDINRELEMSELAKVKQEVQSAVQSFENTVNEHANAVQSEAAAIEKSAAANAESAPPITPTPTASLSQSELLAQQEAGLPAATSTESARPPSPLVRKADPSPQQPSIEQSFDLGIEAPRRIVR